MKKLTLLLYLFCLASLGISQTPQTADKLWGNLFREVQFKRVFADNKTFVDCTPKFAPSVILKKYDQEKNKKDFDLKSFVLQNFNVPVEPDVKVTGGLPIREHIERLWDVLTRKADTLNKYSSLLPLKYPYIVPGGRFREIYYWDSYFTMQGLGVSNRYDLIENMVDNFKYLIDHYGHIPNGNRNYYLGRSQPPYFAMMVELLQEQKGSEVYKKYFSSMEKEYRFWMNGKEKLTASSHVFRRVVRMPDGSILNRHWDDVNAPRQESHAEDVATSKKYAGKDGKVYVNLRAGAESGWDFSSRWFEDTMHLKTIETTDIIPVDLNSLLYAYETILSKAAKVMGQVDKSKYFAQLAQKRKTAVVKYCWNKKLRYFFDYDFKQKHTTDKWAISGAMPLLTQMADMFHAAEVRDRIEEKFLKDGGVATSLYNTGEQWDAPNGWAPLQFIAVKGLLNYHFDALAKTIAERWMMLNEKVFASTGKMLEKYNVDNINLESGGGEYPTQDGFGWTNGVYLKFYELFKK
ncbi:MAG: alpha,alpha-trehalase TreF [Flavisolibacter sp.]